MTEAEWLNESRRSQMMLGHMQSVGLPRTKIGRRKLRLYAIACCRIIWHHTSNDRIVSAIHTAERFADSIATKQELAECHNSVSTEFSFVIMSNPETSAAFKMVADATHSSPFTAALGMTAMPLPFAAIMSEGLSKATLCSLLRCIFGNPFRPVAFAPEWRTSVALGIAAQIYESREFGNLPVLADALEEAGCDHSAVLAHCREPGEHARGCWVVDGVLGKC